MDNPRQLAVEALENAGWHADQARQIVADVEAAGVVLAAPVDGEHPNKQASSVEVHPDMPTQVGELREVLAASAGDVIWRIHGPESTDQESAEQDGGDIADALLPIIAAHVAERERALREEIYADIRAQWRCPHDDPKEQAECYWQNHGEEIIRDLETAREERGEKQ